jgi:hypothetical protein
MRTTTAIRLLLPAALAFMPAVAGAQLELPRENPAARVSQQVGLTEITVEYASPAVRGRRIWGALVPYDRPWSMAAGQPTTIHFSRDVVVGDKPVAAGAYRLSLIPGSGKEPWSFVLAREGAPEAVTRIKAEVRPCPYRERLTFLFADFTDDRAMLDLEWEKLRASISISTNTAQQVMAGIKELDTAWRSYANAARFMLETKKDFDTGLKYANQSLALKEDWYTIWIKAALLAAKHDYRDAIQEGERAYALGQQQGDAFVLEPELKKALADWKKKVQ